MNISIDKKIIGIFFNPLWFKEINKEISSDIKNRFKLTFDKIFIPLNRRFIKIYTNKKFVFRIYNTENKPFSKRDIEKLKNPEKLEGLLKTRLYKLITQKFDNNTVFIFPYSVEKSRELINKFGYVNLIIPFTFYETNYSEWYNTNIPTNQLTTNRVIKYQKHLDNNLICIKITNTLLVFKVDKNLINNNNFNITLNLERNNKSYRIIIPTKIIKNYLQSISD